MAYAEAIRVLCVGGTEDPAVAEVTAAEPVTAVLARSVMEAVELIRERTFECVVIGPTSESDLIYLLNRLREQDSTIPVVVARDPDHPDEVIDALNAGATKYVRLSDPESDLVGLVVHLAADKRVDASLDRYRLLTQAIWAATEAAATGDGRDSIEEALHRQLVETELVQSVWVAHVPATNEFLSVRQPHQSILSRQQVTALIGNSGPEAIERAVSTGTVRTVRRETSDLGAGARQTVIVPVRNDGTVTGLILLSMETVNGLHAADREALSRFGRVIGRLLAMADERLDPGKRTKAVIELVSHEIRNPLTTAMSSLQIARETGEASAFGRVERALEEIERTISTLTTLFIQDTIGEPVQKRFDETALRAWEQTATPVANLELEEIGPIEADHDLLERLLVNVFRNAIQYSEGEVTVSVGALNNGFYIQDDGPGIPPEERDAVFKWGFSTRDEGFGVGLALVKEIVEIHGWSVDLVEAPSGGARFEITGVELMDENQRKEDESEPLSDRE